MPKSVRVSMLGVVAFWLLPVAASAMGIKEGQIIVRFAPGVSADAVLSRSNQRGMKVIRPLVKEMGLYLVQVTGGRETDSVRALSHMDGVVYAQRDHKVTLREVVPNDLSFEKQWSLRSASGIDIKATEAWRLGTGGKDARGNDIVVAIVDNGIDLVHQDLTRNIWKNEGEVAGNGIDDDGNGYVDDVNGWNAYNHSGEIPQGDHGTHVAGIAGAEGNNKLHTAGINWNVKLMAVAASDFQTSVVAEGYGYVLKQKKLWLESKGAKGANIVSTNSSFGVDLAKCDEGEYPVWNDLYKEMGQVGILSAAATANLNIDIDVKGDVPTSCDAEHLIAVTNTDKLDRRHSSAAFGKKHVDIGAPGTAVLSTIPGDAAGEKTGTSMATPHIAGAVAFLHSVASRELQDLIAADPAKGALIIKQILLANVDVISSLEKITLSGGRLNLAKAATAASEYKVR